MKEDNQGKGSRLLTILGKYSSWLVLLITVLIVIEVTMRYVFSSPTSWAHLLATAIYGVYCLIGMLVVQNRHEHINCDVIFNLFNIRVRKWLTRFYSLVGAGVFGLFSYYAYGFAYVSFVRGEVSYDTSWHMPVYPVKIALFLVVLWFCVLNIVQLVQSFRNNSVSD